MARFNVFTVGLLAAMFNLIQAHPTKRHDKVRTLITTDMESDDLASLIRYLLYGNDVENLGLIYTSSQYHWAGDSVGLEPSPLGNNENSTSYRWVGTFWIQDIVLPAYKEVYQNLIKHDPSYPSPEYLLSQVKVGNIISEGEMEQDTEGSDLIKSILLNEDPRPLYLQAWGGTNTIARALKSIEDTHSSSPGWAQLKQTISSKAVILASGLQDQTYRNYISLAWQDIRVHQYSRGWRAWGYNCETGRGNTRGLPDYHDYFVGAWTQQYVQKGPYGRLYRSWLDGQDMPGDQLDIFGHYDRAITSNWCLPLQPYDFLSEGDNVAFNPILPIGIEEPDNPNLGSWGGRLRQNSTSPNLWVSVTTEKNKTNGLEVDDYTFLRWAADVQNDFAARMEWTLTSEYDEANHAPSVEIKNGPKTKAKPRSTIFLRSTSNDPDGDAVVYEWFQYFEEGTYPGRVEISKRGEDGADVVIPADATSGQTISIILSGRDSGRIPLTRYDRLIIEVQ